MSSLFVVMDENLKVIRQSVELGKESEHMLTDSLTEHLEAKVIVQKGNLHSKKQ